MAFNKFQPGDHIYTDRHGGAYYHHGIYVGEANVRNPFTGENKTVKNAVIHFLGSRKIKSTVKPQCNECFYNNEQGVVLTCIHCFFQGKDQSHWFRYEYGVSILKFTHSMNGSCYYRSSARPDIVIKRAYDYYLGNKHFGDYNFVFNNCEHFATMCKTGKARCNQALQGSGLLGSIVYNATRELTEGILWEK